MKQSSVRALVAAVLLAAGLQSSAQSPGQLGPGTPASLKVTLKSAALQQRVRGPFDNILVSTPYTLDVIGGNSQIGGEFTSTTFRVGTYTGVQFDLDENATYSGIDPCTGDQVTEQPIKLADDGASDLMVTYEEPHPVTGLATGALPMDPFQLDSSTPMDLKLVFPVTNALVCLSDTAPTLTASGKQTLIAGPFGLAVDTTNNQYIISSGSTNTVTAQDRATMEASTDPDIPAAYVITGADTQLNAPAGVAFDAADQRILVANSASSTITGYLRADAVASTDGDVIPALTIGGQGTTLTDLNVPGGIFLDTHNDSDPTNDDIVVTNAGNNSVTAYTRSAIDAATVNKVADVAPVYTIAGSNTGLNSPCGVYVDSSGIYVTNNGGNSITVYAPGASGNAVPQQTIRGPKTGLSGPCGIDVYDAPTTNDPNHREIAVASSLNSRVLIFNATDDLNVYPLRRLQGAQTLISGPTGLKVDAANDEIAVISSGGLTRGNLIVRSLNDATPHMTDPPTLVNNITQQTILVNYVFTGSVDGVTGDPLPQADPYTGVPVPTQSAGYNFMWRIYDNKLRQEGNATNSRLIPPPNVVLGLGLDPTTLTPLTLVSNLELGCPAFTPFIILTLSTNCSLPLITTPYPPQSAPDYRLIAALFGQPIIKKLPLTVAPLTLEQLPHLRPHLTLGVDSAIVAMDWDYVDGNDKVIQAPQDLLFQNQSVSINLTRPFTDVDPCYKQVSGNAGTLVYSSPTLGSDARDLTDIKNNRCNILLNDVDTITLTVTDALSNRYVYKVKPSL